MTKDTYLRLRAHEMNSLTISSQAIIYFARFNCLNSFIDSAAVTQQTRTDQELVTLLKEGNAHAFTQLFDRYQPLLFIHARKVTKDSDEAADIVQEVFLSLWDRRHNLEIKGSLLAYLSNAVRFKFIDLMGKKKVRADHANSLSKYIEAGSPVTDHQVRERELLRIIEAEIDNLPPKLKLIYELSRKANMTTAQIASLLDVSEKTVQNQISLAVRQLRIRLDTTNSAYLIIGADLFAELIRKL